MSKKIRVGLIGYGFMGKAHSNAYRQATKFFPDLPYEPELKVFCVRNKERAKKGLKEITIDELVDYELTLEKSDYAPEDFPLSGES